MKNMKLVKLIKLINNNFGCYIFIFVLNYLIDERLYDLTVEFNELGVLFCSFEAL